MKKKLTVFSLLLLIVILIFTSFFLYKNNNTELACSTILVQKNDSVNKQDLFRITLTVFLYKSGHGLIHIYGEAYDDLNVFKVNRSMVLSYLKLENSTYEIRIKSVIKPSLDTVPEKINNKYFTGLNEGAVRILTFSNLNDYVVASISSGAYFICVTP